MSARLASGRSGVYVAQAANGIIKIAISKIPGEHIGRLVRERHEAINLMHYAMLMRSNALIALHRLHATFAERAMGDGWFWIDARPAIEELKTIVAELRPPRRFAGLDLLPRDDLVPDLAPRPSPMIGRSIYTGSASRRR